MGGNTVVQANSIDQSLPIGQIKGGSARKASTYNTNKRIRSSRVKKNNQPSVHKEPAIPPKPHWRLRSLAFGLGLAVLGVVMANTGRSSSDGPPEAAPATAAAHHARDLAVPDRPRQGRSDNEADSEPTRRRVEWHEFVVERGDSLAGLLSNAGVDRQTVHRLATSHPHGPALNQLQPGDRIRIARDADGAIQRLMHQRKPAERLVFNREQDGFASARVKTPLERRLHHATGVIQRSLFAAGTRAGLQDTLINDLVAIFAWDIDFVLDVRRGDRFTVVFERFYTAEGKHVRDGAIVAAEFVNQGERHRAVRYAERDGSAEYFGPNGDSMRKAFLRTPVQFTRISSGYGRRYHPTLSKMQNHHGIDYAAPSGTPIRATGAGRIAYQGRNGAYGRFLVVRHGDRYSTAYGHMRGFARGQSTGSYVEQGEVIGFVGNTGRSTGPHLHYEFRVNGVHKNPLQVDFPPMATISEDERTEFLAHAEPRLGMLDALARTYAARDR